MASDIMAAARDQMLVLIDEQKELVQALRKEEGLLRSRAGDGKERFLDEERAAELVEILDAERAKAERLEITLAVAGTVKAGKSTVVNAIIGTEALPNRARPMTALPTVIRHEPDRFEPALTVNNGAALNKLASRIAHKLQSEEQLEAVRSSHGVDMGALIDDLAKAKPRRRIFDSTYEGRDRVFEALGRINDLLRLGRHEAVGEELDIADYDDLHEMPALAVHFRCLAGTARDTGSLALLDLPGFNEAQLSDHLTEVLEEQLEKASAILVVLDYTQLNTEASEELEILLDAVSGMMRDRIFVVVNKFDQRKSRDPDEKETKAHIRDHMMRGKVDPGHVYPVSAQRAYLASRALDALDRNANLPSADDESWVADFGSLVFPFDQAKLEEPLEVNRAAEHLWEHSGFEPLLNDVIVAAQRRAAALALQSTLDKLKSYGDDIENHLNITDGALTTGVRELQVMIEHMERDIQAIKTVHDDFDSGKTKMENVVDSRIDKETRDLEQKIGSRIKRLYNDEIGRVIQREKHEIAKEEENKDRISVLLSQWRRKSNIEDLEELKRGGKVEYRDADEYREAKAQIEKIYSEIAQPVLNGFLELISEFVQHERDSLSKNLAEVLENTSNKVKMGMAELGIEMTITIPDLELTGDATDAGRIRFSKHKKKRSVTRLRTTNETFAWFNDSWFGEVLGLEWGTERYEAEEEYFEIRRDKTDEELRAAIQKAIEELKKSVKNDVDKWGQDCEDKLREFGVGLSKINRGLIDAQSERTESKGRLEAVIAAARKMKKRADMNRTDIREFATAKDRALGV